MICNDGLYHWGVKGMKWGVRRYQNYDGTLTRAGLQRYGSGDGLSGLIRRSQMKSAVDTYRKSNLRAGANTKKIKELNSYAKNPSAVGKTKIATLIRNRQIESLHKQNKKMHDQGVAALKMIKKLDEIEKYRGSLNAQKQSSKVKRPTGNPKKMTDEELNQRIARLQKEKQYLDLKSGTSPGKTYVTDLLKTSGNKIVGGAAGAIGGAVGKAAVDVIMNHYGDVTAAAVNGSKSAIVGAAFAAAMRA